MRTCSPLKAPKFGSIHPSPCKSLPTSGTTCYFECNHGFLADGGVKTALCGIDGNWNVNETSILKCRGKPYSLVLSCSTVLRTHICILLVTSNLLSLVRNNKKNFIHWVKRLVTNDIIILAPVIQKVHNGNIYQWLNLVFLIVILWIVIYPIGSI